MAKRKKVVAKVKFTIPKRGTKARNALMTKKPPKRKAAKEINPNEAFRKELAKHRKDELIEGLIELAKKGGGVIRRQITDLLDIQLSPDELINATGCAICDATDTDDLDWNDSFGYDDAAYRAIKRNLKKLIELGYLPDAMQLSLELMKQGSYQVEMSHEGLMADDIEECLMVVIKALPKSNLSPEEVVEWCSLMLKKDRVGFICDNELQSLRKKFESKRQ